MNIPRTRTAARGLAAVAAVLMVAACSGGTSSSTTNPSPSDGPATSAGSVQEFQDVVVTGDVLVPFVDDGSDEAIGQPAPALAGSSFSGDPVTIDPASGEPVLLVFVAHWCPHCQAEVPRIVEWAKSTDSDLRVVLIPTAGSSDRPNWPASEWLASEQWNGEVLVDDAAMTALNAYGMTGFPAFVAVNGDGEIAAREVGELGPDVIEELATVLGA